MERNTSCPAQELLAKLPANRSAHNGECHGRVSGLVVGGGRQSTRAAMDSHYKPLYYCATLMYWLISYFVNIM